MTLPDKSFPRSHRNQLFPGNLGQGHNYLLQTRQSVCPEMIQKQKTSNSTQRNADPADQKSFYKIKESVAVSVSLSFA